MPNFSGLLSPLLLAAVLVMATQSSCRIGFLPPGNVVPSGTTRLVQSRLMYRDIAAFVQLPGSGFMLARTGQRDEIHLVLLNDSLKETASYFSPQLRMEQRPLGLVPRNGMVDVISANYQDGDSMALVLSRIDPSTMKEIETKTIISMPQQLGLHYRSTYALAYSPDSSKILVYNFDREQTSPSHLMIDLLLLDLETGAMDTARLPAFLPEKVDYDYSSDDITSRTFLTADGRAYMVYLQSTDTVHLAFYDIFRESFALTLLKIPCLQEHAEFCNPGFMLDERGDLYVVSLAGSSAVIDGLTITKFDGSKPDPVSTRNISFSPSLIGKIKSVPGAASLTIVDLMFNPVTGGGTVMLQPRAEQLQRIEDLNLTGTNPNFSAGDSYVSGDIIAVAFDAKGEKVWETHVASNRLTVLHGPLPHVTARYAGDSLEISYASDNATLATDLYSINISQGTGGAGARRQILQYKGNSYFDLRRMIRLGAGGHLWMSRMGTGKQLWLGSTIDEDLSEIIRTWEFAE